MISICGRRRIAIRVSERKNLIMKMRVICYSKKKKMEQFCQVIADAGECKWDKLPLAYPCDKERLTVFVATVPNDDLRRMVPEMEKARSANIAFLIDGPEGSAKEYIDAIPAGANIFQNVKYVKCGKISFLDKMKDEEKQDVEAWAKSIIADLK